MIRRLAAAAVTAVSVLAVGLALGSADAAPTGAAHCTGTLSDGAAWVADVPAAVRSLRRSSTLTGHLDVPQLTMHTIYDQLAPVEFENRYAAQVRAAGDRALLRQAYVARRGHCAFATSEIIAALRAVEHRVRTGRWDEAATTSRLQADATALALGDGPAFVDFRPGLLVGDR